jgi:hypothetical protein
MGLYKLKRIPSRLCGPNGEDQLVISVLVRVSSLIHRVRDVAEFTAVIMELVGVDDESATLGQTHTSEVGH